MNSVLLTNHLAPGDVCTVTAAVRDLKLSHPNLRIGVDTTAMYLWDNNPNIDKAVNRTNADRVVRVDYPLIQKSNSHPFPFLQAPRIYLAGALGTPIPQGPYQIDIYLTKQETEEEICGIPKGTRYWILDAGFKSDFTCKGWEFERYAEVVKRLKGKVTFVQIGEKNPNHFHRPIPGAINLIGQTNGRKILQLMYHAAGVLTPCSYPMHLSTMVSDPTQVRSLRPCVCILGGREPAVWVQQRNMQLLHCCGALDCCSGGGCWKSRVVPLNDGDEKDNNLCAHPVQTPSGQTVPLCMDMITVDEVVNKILMYEEGWKLGK